MLNIAYSQAAAKELARLPKNTAKALAEKIEAYAADPQAVHRWASWIAGETGMIRIRQGDFRALCELNQDANTLTVHAIGHRRKIYR